MKISSFIITSPLLSLTLLCSCGTKEKNQSTPEISEAAKAHAQWKESLTDSIDSLSALSTQLQSQLANARTTMENMAGKFDVVNDPTLVEKYRVVRGWKGYDTTSKTGILARLLEDNTIELIATLQGGSFNSIRLTSGGNSVTTPVVARDGGNHYVIGTTTRVAFTGTSADEAARLVSDHITEPVTLTFMGGGRQVSITLSQSQKQMIATTWELTNAERTTNELERRVPVIFNKMELFRAEIEKK